jgi:hypothetical protein
MLLRFGFGGPGHAEAQARARRGQSGIMTSNGSNWNAIMQYSFLHVFANDGLIDRDELQMLERLALQDGTVDDKEKDVLTRVFARVNPQTVDPGVWEELQRFKARFDIP